MKKYFLLMLMSGILYGENIVEKTLSTENSGYIIAAVNSRTKKSTSVTSKKTVNKAAVNENTKAKQTTEAKKAGATKNTNTVSSQKASNTDTANTVIDRDRTKQFNDPKNLEKGSYCNKPAGRHQFQEINDKGEYRADIKFQYCMINNEKKENMTVGIIGTDLNAISGYIKKYAYLHLKNSDKLHQNTDGKSYYYDGVWAWSNSSDYPMSAWEEKTNTNKGK